jgi:hypothetical protein
MKKFSISFCGALIALITLLNTSDEWIPIFFQIPSKVVAPGPYRFPPNIHSAIPLFFGGGTGAPSKIYLETNSRGAWMQSSDKPQSAIFTDALPPLFLPTKKRWTSLVNLPHEDFSYPRVPVSELQNQLDSIISNYPTRISDVWLINPGILETKASYQIKDQIAVFRIWNEKVTDHALYELIFLGISKRVERPEKWLSLTVDRGPLLSKNLTTSDFELRARKILSDLEKIKIKLSEKNISFRVVLTPTLREKENARRLYYQFLGKNLDSIHIPVLDLDACFYNTKSSEKTILPNGWIDEAGQLLIADCFNKLNH